jgi:hypothetical protein
VLAVCRGTTVDEVLYPLAVGKQLSHYEDVVNDLMSMDPEGANVRVSTSNRVRYMWLKLGVFCRASDAV